MDDGVFRGRHNSLLELVFKAIKQLTDKKAEQWILLELLKRHPIRLMELFKIMRKDRGYSYDYVSSVLGELVKQGLAVRPRQGKYEPNYKPLLLKMLKILK